MAYLTTDELIAEVSDHWYKKRDGNLYKLLDIFNAKFRKIEDDSEKIEQWRAVSTAEGTTLDLMGGDRKAYRINDNDNFYRFLIYIRFLLSHANGTAENLKHISKTALQTNQPFKIWKTGVRHIDISVPLDGLGDLKMEKFVLDNLQELVALGIWLDKIRWTADTDTQLYIGSATTVSEHYDLVADNL